VQQSRLGSSTPRGTDGILGENFRQGIGELAIKSWNFGAGAHVLSPTGNDRQFRHPFSFS
jgi:hypothetical protein